MPKVKTNSGAKKRFTLTGTGKIKRKKSVSRLPEPVKSSVSTLTKVTF